ncbi:MAG TPA: 1-acyl-sn-glycerol-3-phosphate acyltransferase [Legionellales bacterium]|jgi:1-acyl-sn-glycerol-3-phosphate acyltransferase|nr:1-acyl-sn-glycerol-3-phosphate acyltransferase [Legionellales bacterium]
MKTNFFQTLKIIIQSVYSTLKLCISTLYHGHKGPLSPEWVDEHIQAWVKEILGVVKAKIHVINPQNVQPQHAQATLLMCNHASLYDIPITYAAFPNVSIRMLAKKEMKKIPFMGRSMTLGGFPFIDRHNRQQAIQDMHKVREMLANDIVMWIAPEGTRSRTGYLGNFKKGGFITAIQAQAMIIPIVIRGANEILPAKTLKFSLDQEIHVIIGQPIDASQYAIEQKEELIALVQNTMQNMLDEPIKL